MAPTSLKTLSLGTEEGGGQRNFLDRGARMGSLFSFCFHHSSGLPILLSTTGSRRYCWSSPSRLDTATSEVAPSIESYISSISFFWFSSVRGLFERVLESSDCVSSHCVSCCKLSVSSLSHPFAFDSVVSDEKACALYLGSRRQARTAHFTSSTFANRLVRLSSISCLIVLIPWEDGPWLLSNIFRTWWCMMLSFRSGSSQEWPLPLEKGFQ